MKITGRSGEPLTERDVLPSLMREGIVFLSETDCDEVTERFRRMLSVCRHPHSADAPWTMIQPDPETQKTPGSGGFTRAALLPHTDRSMVDFPPAVLCFLVVDEAAMGGQSLLVDTRPLLSQYSPDSLRYIENDLWLSSRFDGQRRKVVESSENGYTIIRYRDDQVARPEGRSRLSESLLSSLRDMGRSAVGIRLRAGQGYMIHNHRILHGRTRFDGPRKGVRILFRVRRESSYGILNSGFALHRNDSFRKAGV